MEDPAAVLGLVAAAATGEPAAAGAVSPAQIGALLGAMCIRRGFAAGATWSDQEAAALATFRDGFGDYAALLDGRSGDAAVDRVLAGEHLCRDTTAAVLRRIAAGELAPATAAALLIGQRMNIESDDELLGYVDVCRPAHARSVNADSVLHLGEPYDGMARYFRPTLFVAATCAAMGQPVVLHGVRAMPPKNGVTDEQVIAALDGPVDLDLDRAAALVGDADVGFAHINRRAFAPDADAFAELRLHIKKRPAFATAEKSVVVFRGRRASHVVAGYFHPGYERKLLAAMHDQGVDGGVAVKGLEGSTNLALRSRGDEPTFNLWHARDGDGHFDPSAAGFDYADNERARLDAERTAEAGTAALLGEAGSARDTIVVNAAWLLARLGGDDLASAVRRANDAIDSRAAARHLEAYIDGSL